MATERRSAGACVLVIVASLAFVLASGPSVAQAQPTTPAVGVDYAGAMRQGTALYESGNKLGAIQIWEQLVATLGEERGWKVLYNLGLAYESVGDPTRAVERLDAFVRYSASASANVQGQQGQTRELEERRQDALDRLRVIRSTHGVVRVVPPPSGAIVLVRSGVAEPKPAGFVVYLAPGDHAFEIYAGTANARRVTVHSVAGMTTELAVPNLPAIPGTTKEDPKQQPTPTITNAGFPTVWLVVGAGLTVASGSLPLILGLRTADKRDEAEAVPVTSSRYPQARSDFEDARTAYRVSYILPAVFAVAAAVIVILKLPSSPPKGNSAAEGMRWSGVVHF